MRQIVIVIGSIGLGSPATAQDFGGAAAMQSTIIQGATNANIIRGMYDGGAHVGTSGIYVGRPGSAAERDRLASRPRGGYAAGAPSLTSPVDARARPVFLDYTPTAALRRQTVDGLVQRASRKNPDTARVMAAQYAKHDYAKVYRGLTAGAGLRENDAADASAAYTLLGWQIANRDPAEITNAKVAAVRNQVAARLAANPQLSSPAVRASLGEEMKLLYVTLHAGWQGATREGTTRAYSDGIAAMFKVQARSDLRALRLTDAGFVRR